MEIKKLFELKAGDRFYYLNDKSRKIWQVEYIDIGTRISSFNQQVDTVVYNLRDDVKVLKVETKNKPVVYIRHV